MTRSKPISTVHSLASTVLPFSRVIGFLKNQTIRFQNTQKIPWDSVKCYKLSNTPAHRAVIWFKSRRIHHHVRGKEEHKLPILVDIFRMKHMTAKKENSSMYSPKAVLLETLVTDSTMLLCI
jgi:hypothetical protein